VSRLAGVAPPLERYAVATALWTVGTAALAALLGGLGLWRAWLVVPLLLALGVGCAWLVRGLPRIPVGRGPAAALLGVALLAGGLYATTHAEQVLPRRDAGSNLQAAVALATTGERVVRIDPATVGAPGALEVDGITLASPAFFQAGSPDGPRIQPQFPVGPAAVLSLGVWAGQPAGSLVPALLLAPLAMGLAVLTIGLVGASVLGPRAGPVVATGVALAFPVLHTGRSTYSEPLAALTLSAGLLCLVLAARDRSPRAAVLAGLLVGGSTLIRIDALREVVLVVLATVVHAAHRHPWTRQLVLALLGATGVGLLAAAVLSPRYLADISSSLVPLAVAGALVLPLAALAVAGGGGPSRRLARLAPARVLDSARLPTVAALVVLVTGAVLASRPLWLVVRQSPGGPGASVVAGLQLRQGLPVDGGRTYAERTVEWLAWWVGPVALVVALLALAGAAAALVRQWQRGRPPPWAAALVVAAGSSALTLWRPAITPDHPWAERRLVLPIVLVVVLVVVAARWCLGRGLPAPLPQAAAAAVLATLLVPTVAASLPHLPHRVEDGSLAAVDEACAGFMPSDVVLLVDGRGAREWPQVLRGRCGVPALAASPRLWDDPAALAVAVTQVRGHVEATGRRLVLVAAEDPAGIARLSGAEPERLVDRTVMEDARLLVERPESLVPLRIVLWSVPATA
jgi:hypothetical protein